MMINQTDKYKKNNKSSLKDGLIISIGILISVFFVILLLKNINIDIVLQTIQKTPFWSVIGSFLAIAVSSIVRSKAWQEILNNRISFKRSFRSVNEGQLFNTILPFRLGDVARAVFTTNDSNITIVDLLATIFVERVFDIFIMLIILLTTLPLLISQDFLINTVLFSSLFIIIAIAILILIIFFQNFLVKIWKFLFSRISKIEKWGSEKIREVSNSLQILRDLKIFLRITCWMIITWAFALLSLWILLEGFFPSSSWIMPLFLQGVSGLGVSIPSSPGNIGVYEASMVFGLSVFDVEESAAFAFGALHHLLSVLPVIIFGFISLIADGQNFRGWFEKLRNVQRNQS